MCPTNVPDQEHTRRTTIEQVFPFPSPIFFQFEKVRPPFSQHTCHPAMSMEQQRLFLMTNHGLSIDMAGTPAGVARAGGLTDRPSRRYPANHRPLRALTPTTTRGTSLPHSLRYPFSRVLCGARAAPHAIPYRLAKKCNCFGRGIGADGSRPRRRLSARCTARIAARKTRHTSKADQKHFFTLSDETLPEPDPYSRQVGLE